MWEISKKEECKLGTEAAEGKVGSFSKAGRQRRNRFKDRNKEFTVGYLKFELFVRSLNGYQLCSRTCKLKFLSGLQIWI